MTLEEKLYRLREIYADLHSMGLGQATQTLLGQLGEYYVAVRFDEAELPESEFQRGWDLMIEGQKVQVKTKLQRGNKSTGTITHMVDPEGDYEILMLLVANDRGEIITLDQFTREEVYANFITRNSSRKNFQVSVNQIIKTS